MLRRIMIVPIVLLLTVMLSAVAETSDWHSASVVNCDEWISLRSEPSAGSARIAQIPLGEKIMVVPGRSEYILCKYKRQTGFVMAKYIALDEGETVEHKDGDLADATEQMNSWDNKHWNSTTIKKSHRDSDLPAWINNIGEDAFVVPNATEFITLRARADNGSIIREIGIDEQMRVLGWDGMYCLVEIVSTGETGYVNSGYVAARDLEASRWPYDYETMLEDQVMISRNSFIKSEVLDKTADGRSIIVTRIGDDQAKHHILIQCAMHAREIMTSRLGGDLIMMLLNDYPEGIEDVCIHILPLVNPDGQQIALYGPESIRDNGLREAVYGWLNDSSGSYKDWKANAQGVDLNRNFDSGWSALTGRTSGDMRYRGPTPHSEVESQALVQYVDRYPFDCTISIHSYGSFIYWMGAEGVLKQRTKSLAEAVALSTGYEPMNNESGVEKGGFKDWAIEKAGIPSVTIEIGAMDSIGSLEEYSAIALRFRSFIPDIAEWVKHNE